MRWAPLRVLQAAAPLRPGGETGFETRSCGLAALRRFVAEQPYRRVGVSTHGAMVRQLMKHALPPGSPPARTRNTVLYILQYQAVADRLAVPHRRTDRLIGNIERQEP